MRKWTAAFENVKVILQTNSEKHIQSKTSSSVLQKKSRCDPEKEVFQSCPILPSTRGSLGRFTTAFAERSHLQPSIPYNWQLTINFDVQPGNRSQVEVVYIRAGSLSTDWWGKYGSPIQMTSPASLIGSRYMDGKAKLTGACYVLIIIGCCSSGFQRNGCCCWECKVLDFSAVLIMGQEIIYKAAQQSRAAR